MFRVNLYGYGEFFCRSMCYIENLPRFQRRYSVSLSFLHMRCYRATEKPELRHFLRIFMMIEKCVVCARMCSTLLSLLSMARSALARDWWLFFALSSICMPYSSLYSYRYHIHDTYKLSALCPYICIPCALCAHTTQSDLPFVFAVLPPPALTVAVWALFVMASSEPNNARANTHTH